MSEPLLQQVGLDTHVEVDLIDEQGNAERMAFDLVAEKAANFEEGRLSVNTPLGRVIRGKRVGSEVAYVMGDICRRLRLQWDVHEAQAHLYHAWGCPERALPHEQAVAAIVRQIADNVQDPALMRGLPLESLVKAV